MVFIRITRKPHGTKGRWKKHIYEAISEADGCHALNRAIRKYGAENFTVTTVCTLPKAEANAKEIDLIAQHNSQTPNGYNITAGGEGWRGVHADNAKRLNSLSKRRPGDEHLPMHLSKINPAPGMFGYGVKPPNKAPYRSFCSMKLTMEQKLEMAQKYLKDVLANRDTSQGFHDATLPKYVQRHKGYGGRAAGLKVQVKTNGKVTSSKMFTTGSFDEQLQKCKECIVDLKAEGKIPTNDDDNE